MNPLLRGLFLSIIKQGAFDMSDFKIYTPESAPEKSRETLKAIQEKMGMIPNVLGEIAESPALLKGYWELSEANRLGTFTPVELQVVQMTTSWLNDCDYCIAAHSTLAEKGGVPREIIESLRHDAPLKDAKMEALRQFTKTVMKRMGRVEKPDMDAFFKAGYDKSHVFQVIQNVALKLITNYTNHIARTPLDQPFEARKVDGKKKDERKSNAA
jgi:uncharacterized peroxidase-related enzyme